MARPVISVYLQLNNQPPVYVGKRTVTSADDTAAVAQLLRDVADEWEAHQNEGYRIPDATR